MDWSLILKAKNAEEELHEVEGELEKVRLMLLR